MPEPENQKTDINYEDAFQSLFKTSVSGSGEEELLRIASQYSLQITAKQIRCLLALHWFADELKEMGYNSYGQRIKDFAAMWLKLKENNNSDAFVMKALEFISLRRFLGESSFKVDIQK